MLELLSKKQLELFQIIKDDEIEYNIGRLFWRIIIICTFAAIFVTIKIVLPFMKYNSGIQFCKEKKWNEAIEKLELSDFKNSHEWANYAITNYGNNLLYQHDFEEAINQYLQLEGNQESADYIAQIRGVFNHSLQNENIIDYPAYINSSVLDYFTLTQSDVADWEVLEHNFVGGVAKYITYALNGLLNEKRTLFQEYNVCVQFCEMSDYSVAHPEIYYDVTGEKGTYVSSISVKAGEVFPEFNATYTLKEIKELLEKDWGEIDINHYYGSENIDGSDYCDIYRMEFQCGEYLFSIKVFEGVYDRESNLESIHFDSSWNVYILDTKGGVNYDELSGTYVEVGRANNMGESDIESRIPNNNSIMIIKPNNEGYTVTQYVPNENGEWKQVPYYDLGVEFNVIYDDKWGWVAYYTPDWLSEEKIIYQGLECKNTKLVRIGYAVGDGEGWVYQKIQREIMAPVSMMTEVEIEQAKKNNYYVE